MPAKVAKDFVRVDAETKLILKEIAKQDDRSQAATLRLLIQKEASERGLMIGGIDSAVGQAIMPQQLQPA